MCMCYLTNFSYFPTNIAGHGQNKSKMEVLKRGVDGFNYFSLIFSYFKFLPESSLGVCGRGGVMIIIFIIYISELYF